MIFTLLIIITRHHVMIFTLLHHLSSVLSIPYHSHSFSHLNVLVYLILATFSYRFLFYSHEIFSNPGPASRVFSLNMCTLNTRSFTNPLHYTAIKLPHSNLALYNIYRPPQSTIPNLGIQCLSLSF